MGRKWLFISIGAVGTGLLASYMLSAVSARRLLSPSESLFFSLTLLRSLPIVSSTGENGLSAVGLGKQAFAFPVSKSTYSSVVAGQRLEVPLPPHTVSHPDRDRIPHCSENHCLYISFATPEQFKTYYQTTLLKAGWKFADRMGDGRHFRKDNIRLLIIDRPIYYRGTKISEFAVGFSELRQAK
jgi:hypothetical protein